jgi:DNA mismatch repair ATPase MutS
VYFALVSGVLMWGTQWAFAIEAWRRRAGRSIPGWLDAIGEFEALLALATFSAEHPGFVFPEISDGPARFEAADLAHPAMAATAVANPVALGDASSHLLIVSGSNMSGKSTFLRAIGTNAVLAQAGAPVRATACRLSPLAIGASIRVADSLTDGRSHFFAEITRVKAIVDLAAASNGRALFLLDEILAGTNSHDRRIGSEALLTGLVGSGAIGLVTTHDLALGEIADRAQGRAVNVHFEDQFAEGTLQFDYRVRPGIVRTSNAIPLMRSIGLDV